jgi:hypothetical protein
VTYAHQYEAHQAPGRNWTTTETDNATVAVNFIYHRPGGDGLEVAWQGQVSLGQNSLTVSTGVQVAEVVNTAFGQLSIFAQAMAGTGGSPSSTATGQGSFAMGAQLLGDRGGGVSTGLGVQVGATASTGQLPTTDAVFGLIIQWGSTPHRAGNSH